MTGEPLSELTSEETRRVTSLLASLLMPRGVVRPGTMARANAPAPVHVWDALCAWGWVPFPLSSWRMGLAEIVVVLLLYRRRGAYLIHIAGGVVWVRRSRGPWPERAIRWVGHFARSTASFCVATAQARRSSATPEQA